MSDHPLESLSALLDGELAADERRAVEAHVASCPSCARHLRELSEVDALARRLPPVDVPDGYMEALPARVRARIRAERSPVSRMPWIWPLAAGFAVAVLAPLVLREGRSRDAASDLEREATPPPVAAVPPAGAPVAGPKEEKRAAVPPAAATVVAPPARPQAQGYAAAPARESSPPAAKVLQDRERDAQRFGAAGGAPPSAARRAAAPESAPVAAGAPATRAEEGVAADEIASATGGNRANETGRIAPDTARDAAVARRDAAPSLMRKSADTAAVSAGERDFGVAAAIPLSSAESARRARQAWVRFLADHPQSARADEARVRLVEASVAAFRVSGDRADRIAAERDAHAYLTSAESPQAQRVRAALRRLDAPR